MTLGSLEELVVETAQMVRPPERLTVAESAERYRKLNNPGAYVGPWSNDMTPYMVEPMEVLSDLLFTAMIFAGPAQCAKTDIALNWITHTAVCDPADMMLIQTSQSTARDFHKRRIERLFRHSPDVGNRVLPGRNNQNTFDTKFKSGWLLTLSWPTINELSGKPIPRLWLTDYDRMPQDVDKEGAPFDLARKRATTFRRFGMTVAESSPGFVVDDPSWRPSTPHEAPPTKGILSLYNRGDRRRWHWHCPQCKEWFEPDFSLLNYPKSDDHMESAEQTVMVCPHDGFPMTPDMKHDLNVRGRWVKEGQTLRPDGSVVGRGVRSDIASFWLKGPAAAFAEWRILVLNYLKAMEEYEKTQTEEALKTTVNTDQGLPYLPRARMSDRLPENLKSRAMDWGGSSDSPVVPEGVRFLVATVDTQARSFVVHVHGFGPGGDVWVVDMFKIRKSARLDDDGDPLPLDPGGYLEDWETLIGAVLERTYPLGDNSGRQMQIKVVGCDSGGAAGVTVNAYKFWRYLRDEHNAGHHARFMLIKGEPSKSAPRLRVSYPDASRKDRHSGARGDVPVVFLNSDLLKDQVHAMLGRTEPGGGMVNFPVWAEDWLYKQLTSEVKTAKGWVKPGGVRNEAFDLLYYAVGLGLHPYIRLEHIDWQKPPSWAAPWDANDLVFGPKNTKRFASHEKRAYTLKELASKLA